MANLPASLPKYARAKSALSFIHRLEKIMKRIFLDIETLPTEEANREFVENKTREKLLKRGEELDNAKLVSLIQTALRETALRGSLGRLLCVGLIVEKDGALLHHGVFGQDRETCEFHLNESKTLAQFWNFLKKLRFDPQRDLIVGHNILGFDLPFLYQRSMIFSVPPTFELEFNPYRSQPIYDTMRQWAKLNPREFIGLEELALAFGLECPKKGSVNGENMLEAYMQGRHKEIRQYCMADVRCTREIYYRMIFQTPPQLLENEKTKKEFRSANKNYYGENSTNNYEYGTADTGTYAQ